MKNPNERQETRHIRSLRREVIKLRREVSQLRKKNMRLENDTLYGIEEEEEVGFEYIVENPNEKKDRFTCPDCGGYDTYEFKAGVHDFYSCGSCKSRGRKKNTSQAS